jgi:hypothetical protein
VDHIAASALALSSQATGDWHGATGIPLAFLGLLLAWLGMLALDIASRQLTVSPSTQPTEGVPALSTPGD